MTILLDKWELLNMSSFARAVMILWALAGGDLKRIAQWVF